VVVVDDLQDNAEFLQRCLRKEYEVFTFTDPKEALAMLQKQDKSTPIYSDSRTAMGWVRQKIVRSKLPRNQDTEKVWDLADRALAWLKNNSYSNEILDWKTQKWGEIRADFGRK
jgi:ribonuclease HI